MALSLNLMDRTVEVMRNHVVDDVHLSNRFSNFLEVITNRLRPMIVRMSRTNGSSSHNAASRVSSRPPSPGLQNRSTEHMPAYPADPYNDGQQQRSDSNALYGIPTQTYDLGDNNNTFSIMPPPTNMPSPSLGPSSINHHPSSSDHPQDYNFGAYSDGFVGGEDGTYDWLALPLDPILQAGGQDVTANCFGPGIGEFDMLEVLLGGGHGQHGQGDGIGGLGQHGH